MSFNTGKNTQANTQANPQSVNPQETQETPSYVSALFQNASDYSGQSDENAAAATEILNKISLTKSEQGLNPMQISFTLVDSEPGALPFIVGYNKKGTHAMFSLLIEEGLYGGPLSNEELNIHGHQVQLDVDTSNCYDNILINLGKNAVRNNSGIDPVASGYMVIKSSMDITNTAYAAKLYGTVESNIRSLQGNPLPNLNQLAQSNLMLKISHEIHPGENVTDLEGNPISADFTSTLTVSVPTKSAKNEKSLNRGRKSMLLAKVSGVADFIFGPAQQPKHSRLTREDWLPCVYPCINITNCTAVDAKTKLSNESTETNLYGLLAIAQVAEKGNFLSIFRRTQTDKPSLGALGYLWEPHVSPSVEFVPREIPITTGMGDSKKKDALTVDTLADRFFHDSMDFVMDIRKGGRNCWTQELFLKTALGDATAAKELFDIFNEFTNGEFAKVWDSNVPIMQQGVISVHAGTYMSSDGPRDIRDYGLLKLTSLYGKEASTAMRDYARTMELGGSNGEQGLINIDARRKTLKHLAVMTEDGLYDRVIFATDALQALLLAAKAAKIVIASEGLYDPSAGQYIPGGNFRASSNVQGGGLYNSGANGPDVSTGGFYHNPRY